MATTTFVAKTTTIEADWLNEVDALVFDVFNGKSSAGTSGTILRSNGANIVNTTATYPATTTANQLLYSSAANTIGGLTSAASSVLVTDSSSVPSLSTTLPDGLTMNARDSIFRIVGSADSTKKVAIEVDGITTGTTRTWTAPDYAVRIGNLPAGIIAPYAGSSVPDGWLECDGSAVSRTIYSALFTAISTTWGTGDGSSTFNLPDFRDKVPIGSGTGTVTASGSNADVDTTNDTLTVAANNTKWITGMAVVFNLSSGTITGLSDDTTYYVIRNSSTTIKLASSLANAQNGTAIDMTAKSSPVWDITHTYTARTLGEYGGEESHAMSITELLAHTHTTGSSINSDGPTQNPVLDDSGSGNVTGSRGGNAAMNIMQPFGVVKYIISY